MIGLNLLAAARRRSWRQRLAEASWPTAGVALFAFMAIELGAACFQFRDERARLGGLLHAVGDRAGHPTDAEPRAQALRTTGRGLAGRLDALTRVIDERLAVLDLLASVSRGAPDDVWLIELKQERDNVLIDGRAASIAAVAEFAERLRGSRDGAPLVDIRATTTEVVDRLPVVRFQLAMRKRG